MFEDLGIVSVVVHEVLAFTPASRIQSVVDVMVDGNGDGLPDDWQRLRSNERFYRAGDGNWQKATGLPCRDQRSYAALGTAEQNMALRILREGSVVVTKVGCPPSEESLVSRVGALADSRDSAECVRSKLQSLADLERGDFPQDQLNGANLLDEMTAVGFDVERQRTYPVVELAITDPETVRNIAKGHRDRKLDQLLLYLVSRNYWLDEQEPVNLWQLVEEVLAEGLDDDWLLVPSPDEPPRLHLKNLSQGNRLFIAFGRRGTVIVHSPNMHSMPIRCSVLNAVEALRGRLQNLIVANSLMDSILLRLARLSRTNLAADVVETQQTTRVLWDIGEANYVYGISVADPTVNLLDGSILSVIADRAEQYFEIMSLRHACEHKMHAIRALWASYQDNRRMTLLSKFHFAEHQQAKQ